MEKVRIGVLGAYRGTGMINYCKAAQNAEVVAICDKWTEGLERQKEQNVGLDITYYDNFEDFIRHDMDAVVLANYANEHAPFAIRALKEGKHVFSEVLPAQTMKEAVELIETVESSGLVYAYGENYCYMPAPYEMKKLYEENVLGELEYAECEYLHNCESIWPSIAYGDKNHWRNNMYSTFYCTHSLGPIIHATGLRPVSVIGIEGTQNARCLRVGRKSGSYGMELVTLENGGVIKSLHGGLYKNSIWYSINGSKGRAESAREDALLGDVHHLYLNVDGYDGEYNHNLPTAYKPTRELDHIANGYGHGGSDFYCMYHFVEKILGNEKADIIDVYEAMDMFLPGMFAYRSILAGNIPMEIPNLRDKAVREQYRNDTACTSPEVAGDQLLPTFSKGTPAISDEVYAEQYRLWRKEFEANEGYTKAAFTQGDGKNT